MKKITEEEFKDLKESRYKTEMMFLENKDRITKEINEMYQNDLKADLTLLNKEDWFMNFFMELYTAVNIFRMQEESKEE